MEQTTQNATPLDLRYADALAAMTPAQALLDEIAAAARVSVFTARAWVNGKQMPTPQAMALLSAHFEVAEEELFTQGHFAENEKP